MDDWVGQNTNSNNQFANGQSTFAPDNNYDIISATSVGGQVQSKVNFTTADDPPEPIIPTLDTPFIFLADQQLEGGFQNQGLYSFADDLHMTGTISFSSPQATEPNFCFCWYNSENTAHRIGLGISNRSVAQGGALTNALRMDFGYGATGGNRFYYASSDGNQPNTSVDSVLPEGTHQFSFDYEPFHPDGARMSLTVGDFFKTVQPLETAPYDLDFFDLDRFGIVQRATGNQTQLGSYNVTFSNVTYTGGTDAPDVSGDHNGDGAVDGADYVAWRKDSVAFGGAGGFQAWRQDYGGAPGSGSGGVPEPSSILLAVVASVLGLLNRRNSRGC